MTFFRHPLLREWSSEQQRRFRPLLAMPAPQAADMCSECQAPADWHLRTVFAAVARHARARIDRGEASGAAAWLVGPMPRMHRLPDPPPVGRYQRAARLRRRPVAGDADTCPAGHLRARPDDATQTARPARRAAATASRRRSPSRTTPQATRRLQPRPQRARAVTSPNPDAKGNQRGALASRPINRRPRTSRTPSCWTTSRWARPPHQCRNDGRRVAPLITVLPTWT
jgi:hypothetical protein